MMIRTLNYHHENRLQVLLDIPGEPLRQWNLQYPDCCSEAVEWFRSVLSDISWELEPDDSSLQQMERVYELADSAEDALEDAMSRLRELESRLEDLRRAARETAS